MNCFAIIVDNHTRFLPVDTTQAAATVELSHEAEQTSKPARLVEIEASSAGWRQRPICAVVDGEFYMARRPEWQ